MAFGLEFFAYLVAGLIIILLHIVKKKGLSDLSHDIVPELDEKTFLEVKELLQTSYERTLYLGIAFLFLAYLTLTRWGFDLKAACILVIVILFFYNIRPRNKALKLLLSSGIDWKTVRKRGVSL